SAARTTSAVTTSRQSNASGRCARSNPSLCRPCASHGDAHAVALLTVSLPSEVSTAFAAAGSCELSQTPPAWSWLFRIGGRVTQGADDRAPGQHDLEVVVAEPGGAAQDRVRGALETLLGGALTAQERLGLAITPGLVRHAAQGQARLRDRALVQLQ